MKERQISPRALTWWNLFFQYFSIFVNVCSGVVLAPITLWYVHSDTYGAWLATGNILAWITIVDPGVSTILIQRVGVAYGNRDKEELGTLISTGILLSALFAIILALIGLFVSSYVVENLNVPSSVDRSSLLAAFRIAIIGTALSVFSYGPAGINAGLQGTLGLGTMFCSIMICALVATGVLLVLRYGLMALSLGLLLRGTFLSIGNLLYLRHRLNQEGLAAPLKTVRIHSLLGSLGYNFIGRLSLVLSGNIDSLIVTQFLSAESATILNMTKKGPDISKTLLERPSNALLPAIANLSGRRSKEELKPIFFQLTFLLIWGLGFVAIASYCLNAIFVELWVGGQYFAGNSVNISVAALVVVTVVATTYSNLTIALGHIREVNVCTTLNSIVSLPLMMYGTYYYGIVGTVLAPVCACLLTSFWYQPYLLSRFLNVSICEFRSFGYEILFSVCSGIIAVLFFLNVAISNSWIGFFQAACLIGLLYMSGLILLSKRVRNQLNRFLPFRRICSN